MSKQKLLFWGKLTRTDVYTFRINSGGNLEIKDSGTIKIVFVNKKFDNASFNFSGILSRNQWRILAAINKKIEYLEKRYSK